MSVLKPERCKCCGAMRKRSQEANRAYWALLHDIAEQVKPAKQEYSAETWHEYFKRKLLGAEEVKLPNGRIILKSYSTADLDKEEFSEYMTKIEVFASERGVIRNET